MRVTLTHHVSAGAIGRIEFWTNRRMKTPNITDTDHMFY